MRTEYDFQVDTCRTSKVPFEISTKNAKISFFPDSGGSNEIRNARVSVSGHSLSGNQSVAWTELVKVLVVHFGPQASCSLHPLGWTEVREEGDDKNIKVGVGLTLSSRARFVSPIDPSVKAIRAKVDGDMNTLLQYYKASRKEDPEDRYLQLFRVLEYMSGPKPSMRRLTKHVMMGLGGYWDISPSVLKRAMSTANWNVLSNKHDLARELCRIRGMCAHFYPKYGFLPFESRSRTTLLEALPIIEEIVKDSLEMNPLTKES